MLLGKVKLDKTAWAWITIAMVYYLLVRQNMFICDDFRYAFVQGTDNYVNGWGDAVRSQMYAYVHENGRFLVHTIVQYFAGVLGIEWLRVANTFIFVSICIFINKLLSSRNSTHEVSYALIVLALILCIPVPGYSYLGNIAMSVNYLWSSSLSLAFIYILELYLYESRRAYSHHCLVLLMSFSFVVGAWQESFSIGMSVALFAFVCIKKKNIDKATLMIILSYWIGASFVILAPSNVLREASWNGENTSLASRFIQGFGSVAVYAKTFDAMVLLLLGLFFYNKHKLINIVKMDLIFILTSVVNVFFVACVAFTGPHQLVCVELFSSIVLLHILTEIVGSFSYSKASLTASIVIFILLMPIYYYRSKVNEAYYQMIERAKSSTDGYLIGGSYDSISYKPRNWIVKTYTTTEKNQNCPLGTLSMWLTKGIDKDLLRMRIPLSKEELINICDEQNEEQPGVFHRCEDWFYIVKTDSLSKQIKVGFKENKLSTLRSRLFGRYQEVQYRIDDLSKFSYFSDRQNKYYVIYDEDSYPIVNIELITEIR